MVLTMESKIGVVERGKWIGCQDNRNDRRDGREANCGREEPNQDYGLATVGG